MCKFSILLYFKAFVLFVMCLFTQFTVAEEGFYLSAISSSEAERVESSEVNTSSGVETSSDVGQSLKAVEGDLKTSYKVVIHFPLIKAACNWSSCGDYRQCYQAIVFHCMFCNIDGCWDACDPSFGLDLTMFLT